MNSSPRCFFSPRWFRAIEKSGQSVPDEKNNHIRCVDPSTSNDWVFMKHCLKVCCILHEQKMLTKFNIFIWLAQCINLFTISFIPWERLFNCDDARFIFIHSFIHYQFSCHFKWHRWRQDAWKQSLKEMEENRIRWKLCNEISKQRGMQPGFEPGFETRFLVLLSSWVPPPRALCLTMHVMGSSMFYLSRGR